MKDFIVEVERSEREVAVFIVDEETRERIGRIRFSDEMFDLLFPSARATAGLELYRDEA